MQTSSNILHGRKIAILAADGFDESQLFSPKYALEAAGAEVVIVSLNEGNIKSWDEDHWGKSIPVDATVKDSSVKDFDALVIPGGHVGPNVLSQDKCTINFVKDFINEGKSIATICHGTEVIIETGLTKGRTLTAWPSLKNDLIKSGAKWRDEQVVVYKGIISSRCPTPNLKFNKKMIEGFSISPRSQKSSLL
ncbi:MAG: type 1 glutamine amidotransferase domain-containing protein [Bacteriovorax sp.]|nr:type 1 glutamine amidotransferase domain-containing protein [Bacteriovorax sp.]